MQNIFAFNLTRNGKIFNLKIRLFEDDIPQ